MIKLTHQITAIMLLVFCSFQYTYAEDIEPRRTPQSVVWEVSDQAITAHLNWCEYYRSLKDEDCDLLKIQKGSLPSVTLEKPRISERHRSYIKVEGFNFVNYGIETTVNESVVEGYVFLNDMWKQLLDLDVFELLSWQGQLLLDDSEPQKSNKEKSSADLLLEWWGEINHLSTDIQQASHQFSSTSILSKIRMRDLSTRKDLVSRGTIELEDLRKQAFEKIIRQENTGLNEASIVATLIETYESINSQHEIVQNQASIFIQLANKSISGELIDLGKKKAGTAVNVIMQSKQIASNQNELLKPVEIDYLSESETPLDFHAGLTLSSLKSTDFKTVRSVSSGDLFAQVQDESNTANLSVFLSKPMLRDKKGNTNWFGTLGTDISDLGDNIYLGVSRRFKEKWFLTLGGAYGKQVSGQGLVVETDVSGEPSRNLYELIEENRELEFFISISYSLF